MKRERFEKAIKDAIVNRKAETQSERNKIYEAARASLRRNPSHTADGLAQLDVVIAAIESTFAKPVPSPLHRGIGWLRIAGAAFVVGAIIGAAAMYFGKPSAAPAGDMEKLATAYHANVAQVPIARDFLSEVVAGIVERQKNNRASLAAISKGFIPLAKFDPVLNSKQPKSLPTGTAVLVRADASNVKVIMNWPLCGVVSVSNPEMVDIVRSPVPTIGCPYFGLWTPGAARW